MPNFSMKKASQSINAAPENGEASRFFCPLGFNIKGLFLRLPFRWQTKLNMSENSLPGLFLTVAINLTYNSKKKNTKRNKSFVSSLSGWRWEQKKFLAFVGHSYNLVIHENAVPGSHGKLIICTRDNCFFLVKYFAQLYMLNRNFLYLISTDMIK
jgi:hypothetical protein